MDDSHQRASYFAAVVEFSDDAFLGEDTKGVIEACNPAAERLFDYSEEELVGRPASFLIPSERQESEERILERVLQGERVEHFDTVRLTKQGRRIAVSVTVSPVRDSTGKILGTSSIVRDVTERNLRDDSQALLAAIVKSSDDAIISKDLNGVIRSCNEAAERMFGYTSAELIGRPVTILLPTDRLSEETQILARLRRGERVYHFETVRITKDRRLIDVSLTISPVRNAAGVIIGASKIARDITDRRRAEAFQAEAAAERERLLASERAARGEAERASRVKDDFVATVSHELRTPLNAILGWTEVLLRRPYEPTEFQHGLEVVARNARSQAQLISDLLDVSRIVSGKLSLDVQSVDLPSIITASIETVQHAADAKRIQIHSTLDTTIGLIVGDRSRLQQVVWNLLSNAIKFTPKGGRITAELMRAGSHAEIIVSDTGEGIAPETVDRVFDRFSQANAPTTRQTSGLGLGLSIAKHLVELHGGRIRAASPGLGKGATFTIELPLSVTRLPQSEENRFEPREAASSRGADEVSLRNLNVLVVDDEPDTLDLIRRVLETHHATVTTADSATAALDLLDSAQPDILVSDIGLPKINGYELIRRIRRRDDPVGRIPAIALTAFARSEDRTQALRAGYQAHVTKPVEPAELVITVASFAGLGIPRPQRRSETTSKHG